MTFSLFHYFLLIMMMWCVYIIMSERNKENPNEKLAFNAFSIFMSFPIIFILKCIHTLLLVLMRVSR